jgi:F-type H+-transporting ATPase subunit gamma
VEEIANDLIHRYGEEKIDEAYIVYMRFVSAGVQRPNIIRLLPLSKEENAEDATPAGQSATTSLTYDFSPSPDALLAELLPLSVKTRLFGCFLDAAVSEQAARMVAMKSATDSASDMIKFLSTQYNRARQTQITLELLDIIGGAEALK